MPDEPQPPADISADALSARLSVIRRQLDDIPSERLDKSRRDLLIASMIGLVTSVTGAVPTKIETLGVEFTELEQSYFFVFMGLVVLYFVLKFWSQSAQRRLKIYFLKAEARHLMHRLPQEQPQRYTIYNHMTMAHQLVTAIEVWIPLCLAILSTAVSFYAAIKGLIVTQP